MTRALPAVRRLRPRRRGLGGDQRGASTVSFVILFPLVISMVFSMVEAGWLMTRAVMLERGLDVAVRYLRLGVDSNMTHEELRTRICDASIVLRNCERDLLIELREMDLAADYPQNQANCIDRTGEIDPVVDFSPGARERIMFVRACMVIDPVVPGMGLGLQLPKDASGGFHLVSYTAFISEPS